MKWAASWIWNDLPPNTPNVYLEARKIVNLERPADEAVLHISANQEYVCTINGTYIGRGPSPSDCSAKVFDTYDLTPYLQRGENTIAIVAYNFGTTHIMNNQLQGPGGIIAELHAALGDEEIVVGTDGSWKCRRSPRWVTNVSRQHLWHGFREIYLADKEDGWELPGYDDASWSSATVVAAAEQADSPWPRLIPRSIPFLASEQVQPVSIVRTDLNFGSVHRADSLVKGSGKPKEAIIDASRPGSFPGIVYDYERVVVGYPRLTVDAPDGGVIQLFYGESLEMALYDTFILKKGLNRLSPFGRRAFRFLQLSVQAAPQPIKVLALDMKRVHYAFGPAGTFESDDELLNRIWEVGLYTTYANSQDHIEDCPLRERALWVADAVVVGKVVYHAFGDTALLRKCLIQGAQIQNEDGSIPGTGPERNSTVLPDFCAHWLFGVYTHWTYTRDLSFVKDLWPAILRLMDWFADQEDETGLFANADRPGWWCFIDWADYIERRDRVTAVNCFYYKALKEAAEMAKAVGDDANIKKWLQRAETLRESIRRQLWVPSEQAFADCLSRDGLSNRITLQTNLSAIWTGVMNKEEADRFLTHRLGSGDLPVIKGAFFYHIVLETLFERGYGRQAMEMLRSFWGGMMERGATTWWETFDPTTPFCTVPGPYQGNTPTYLQDHVPVSFCHAWGASPTYLLTQRVLGVDMLEFGSNVVTLSPYIGNLKRARGEVPTPKGTIRAEWMVEDDGSVIYKAVLPDGIRWQTHRGNGSIGVTNIRYEINGERQS